MTAEELNGSEYNKGDSSRSQTQREESRNNEEKEIKVSDGLLKKCLS